MINVVIVGISGKMGKYLLEEASVLPDIKIVGGVDAVKREGLSCPFYETLEQLSKTPDCIVDFSHPAALTAILNYAVKNAVPVVLCTTGHSAAQVKEIEKAAARIPILKSGNMSLGVNAILDLIRKAAETLTDFDIEIMEAHHNGKSDAPSGTALMLFDAANSGLKEKKRLVYGRNPDSGRREKDEIGMHSLRGGTVPGQHEVFFFGSDEVVTISHTALSKRIFAAGAFKAARFLIGQPAGLYSMREVLTYKV